MNGRRSRMIRRGMALALTAKPAAVGVVALAPRLANASAPVACPAGVGDVNALKTQISAGGTVTLVSGCTFTLTTADTPNEGLPLVTKAVVINGNGATITRSAAAPSFRIFHVRRAGDLTLNNVTISNGLTVNNVGGGGIYNQLGKLTLMSSTISGNRATATLAVSNFSGSDASGGGILTTGTTLISNSVISGNQAIAHSKTVNQTTTGELQATGGGIAAKGGALKIVNTAISQNTASSIGEGSPVLATGGGIAAKGASRLRAPSSSIATQPPSTLTILGSALTGNAATATQSAPTSATFTSGGAIGEIRFSASIGPLLTTVVNSTLAQNSAMGTGGTSQSGVGGAATFNPGTNDTVSMINDTVAANTTGGSTNSGAINSGSRAVTLTNTIVANQALGKNCAGTITDGGANISFPLADKTCTATFGQGDPVLGPLQNNGGLTQTMALGTGSAAIDSAFAIPCGQAQPAGAGGIDQRGLPRIEVVADPKCDIGAYEVQPVVAAVQPAASAVPTLPKAGTTGDGSGQGMPWPAVPAAVLAAGALAAAGRRLRGERQD